MALDNTAAQVLCGVTSAGANFTWTLMIGRQWLTTAPEVINAVAEVHGLTVPPRDPDNPFAELFFAMLGAERVDSLDFSTFEGANIQHDLNQPLSKELHFQYHLVFDGDTLEHIFNFSLALKSCMELVRSGGHFVQVTNANHSWGTASGRLARS